MIDGLSDAHVDLALNHAAGADWAASARDAREAIKLRSAAAELGGRPLKASASAHGVLANATFMLEGNTPALRAELGRVLAEEVASPGLRALLANLHVMARDFEAARAALGDARPAEAGLINTLGKLVGVRGGEAWEKHPCNFYTYRYSLVASPRIQEIVAELRALDAPAIESFGIHRDDVDIARAVAIDCLGCHDAWNRGNAAFERGNYRQAALFYVDASQAIRKFFFVHRGVANPSQLITPGAIWRHRDKEVHAPRWLITHFRNRYRAASLEELYKIDWRRPHETSDAVAPYQNAQGILTAIGRWADKFEEKIDAPLATLYFALLPLAIAEAGLARRRLEETTEAPAAGTGALQSVNLAITNHDKHKVLSEIVERPFAAILKARILLRKADNAYKARLEAKPKQLDTNGVVRYQGLQAAKLYQGVLDHFHRAGYWTYVDEVGTAHAALRQRLVDLRARVHDQHARDLRARDATPADPTGALPPDAQPNETAELKQLGLGVLLPGARTTEPHLPGLGPRVAPHVALLQFNEVRDSNPVIFALVAEAKARLLQLDAGFNWLGYRDDYVPPWRFGFLLERARYFARHAADVQSTYLNFLANAEREELQEQSAGQAAALELANVAVEAGRVEHATAHLTAAQASTQLARLVSRNAEQRHQRYLAFERYTRERARRSGFWSRIGSAAGVISSFVGGGGGIGAMALGAFNPGAGLVIGGLSLVSAIAADQQQQSERDVQSEQRAMERENLRLAAREADESIMVAQAQELASAAGVEVAGLTRLVALMRHDFALQALAFVRNRTTGAELWYRLADALRAVSDQYLNRAVELAFLAEQALELETSRRRDVIRFDYDVSELGNYLAASFLLRDLDSLEHALLTEETQRRQRVRFVVSLARDFPEALEELRRTGRCLLPVTLLPLERRFPGLYNLKVASVGVLPVALMDPTRFSLKLTHFGAGSIRTPARQTLPISSVPAGGPGGETEITSWCATADPDIDRGWPVKLRIAGPETAVFSGLSRTDELQDDTFFAANERGAFEGASPAATWQLDMSMRENRVVAESLADVVLTLTLTGYHSEELAQRIVRCIPTMSVEHPWLSARRDFADSYHTFMRTGELALRVTEAHVPVALRPGALRNVAVVLAPGPPEVDFGRLFARHRIDLLVAPDGSVTRRSAMPQFDLSIDRLTVSLSARFDQPVNDVRVRFEEGAAFETLAGTAEHVYPAAGVRTITVRARQGHALLEHTISVAVAADENLSPPLLAAPSVSASAAGGVEVIAPAGLWMHTATSTGARSDGESAWRSNLPPGPHALFITLARELQVELGCAQRLPGASFQTEGLRLSTNRTFSDDGAETTASPSALTAALLANPGLAALDEWRVVVRESDNPFLRSVNRAGTKVLDLSELGDVILLLEYEAFRTE